MLIDEATFVVTDTETTGLRPGPHRVIEVGAVKIEGGEITRSFSRLVNPGEPVPRQITRLTGITDSMVRVARPASEVLPTFLDFLGDGYFVGHNAAFDRKFLQFELRKASIDFKIGSALCTRRIARRILHALPSKSLSSLMQHYRITAARRHRALDDAQATAEVFLRLVTALKNEIGITRVDELLKLQYARHDKHRSVPPSIQRIRSEYLGLLPDAPGVYLFKDSAGSLLYVGKARSLKNRVRTYFVGLDTHPLRIRRLVKAIRDIDFIPTPTELSALILESRLIKAYQPRYNRAEVRFRNLPFLRVPAGEDDEPDWSLEIHADGAAYYGPLANKPQAELLLRIVRRHPDLFNGGFDRAFEAIQSEMRDSAERLDFERAGELRDEAALLTAFRSRPYRTGFSVLDHNAIWIGRSPTRVEGTVLAIRHGRLASDLTVALPPSAEELDQLEKTIQARFGHSADSADPYRRREIDEIRVIASWIYRNREQLVVVPVEADEPTSTLLQKVLDRLAVDRRGEPEN